MRSILTATLLVAAAFLLGANPPTPTPTPTAPPAGMPKHVPGLNRPGTDLVDRVKASPYIARGHVLPAATGGDTTFKVHIDRWLKGTGANDPVVDFNGQRPLTPDGSAELFFMGPPLSHDGGKASYDLRVVTETAERYEGPDSQSAQLDQAVLDLLSGAPENQVLSSLTQLVPRFSLPAASRLALRASNDPDALAVADVAAQSPKTTLEARVMLVSMLGSRLQATTLGELTKPGADERLRMAALDGLGRTAANEPSRRAAAVSALDAAGQDSNPHVKLAAGMGLAEAGQPSALPPLDAVLAGSDQPLRAEAVRGLALLAHAGNTDAVSRLEKLQGDADPEVKARAKNLLGEIGPKPVAAPASAAAASPSIPPFAIISGVLVGALLAVWFIRRRK